MAVALITGANSGLGFSLGLRLAKAGIDVAAGVRKLENGAALIAESENVSAAVELVVCDVTDRESVAAAVAATIERFGSLDFLICNAGIGYAKPLEDATYEEMHDVFSVNYWGVVHCIKAALPQMRKQKHGKILAISSIGGLIGQPFNEVYCASKFAVEGLIESLATYLKPAFNIDLSLVEPGGMRSRFFETALKNSSKNSPIVPDSAYKDVVSSYLEKSQSRSANAEEVFQSPEEVAELVEGILLSDVAPLRARTSKWANDFCRHKTEVDPDGTKSLEMVRKMML